MKKKIEYKKRKEIKRKKNAAQKMQRKKNKTGINSQ